MTHPWPFFYLYTHARGVHEGTAMYEIIWYGRGGQGVVLASEIVAESAYIQGFKGVTTAPTFGPERRGAPLTASTRISEEPIRTFSQIEYADYAVVLDESLLDIMNIPERLKETGTIIINTSRCLEDLSLNGCHSAVVIDAARIAREQRLFVGGLPTVNTPLVGSFVKMSGLITLDNIQRGIRKKMAEDQAYANFEAIRIAYERTGAPKED